MRFFFLVILFGIELFEIDKYSSCFAENQILSSNEQDLQLFVVLDTKGILKSFDGNISTTYVPQGFIFMGKKVDERNAIMVYPFYGKLNANLQNWKNTKMQRDEQVDYLGYGVLRRYGAYLKWTCQWFIGTGKIGAIVGGMLSKELIPLSVANLFVKKRTQQSQTNLYQKAKEGFSNARRELINGNMAAVSKSMESTEINIADSHLEYGADMTFCFSTNKFPKTILKGSQVELSVKDKDSRQQPFEALKTVFPTCEGEDKDQLQYHVSFLDTLTGLTTSLFVTKDLTIHRREWFGSIGRDAIIGTIDCKSLKGNPNCLHMVLRLSRQSGWHSPTVTVSRHNEKDIEFIRNGSPYQSSTATMQGIDLTIAPSKIAITPHVHVCMAVICHKSKSSPTSSSSSSSTTNQNDADDTWEKALQDTILCHDASKAEVISSIEIEETSEVSSTATQNQAKQDELRQKCWAKISRVLKTGIPSLRERHIKSFHNKMSRTSLQILDIPLLKSFPNSTYYFESPLKSDGALGPGKSRMALSEGAFHLGKYLLLTGGSGAVMNLQGVWADGRKSMWSGDYHININMQMQYWPADTTRLVETLPPLFAFIKRLAHAGQATAKDMYGCPGWVAHGFTDGYLVTGVGGAYIWAFCVTCGAWMALSLWDHLTFTMDLEVLVNDLIPIFRGISEFFTDHMWKDGKGILHTGPTTSPETSYRSKKGGSFLDHQVGFTPAIDSSILRQVANAYVLAVDVANTLLKTKKSKRVNTENLNLEEEASRAQAFRATVLLMPFQALPVAGKTTNVILEYPSPIPGAIVDLSPSYSMKNPQNRYIEENVDMGHRHYSALHWLYPGLFLPNDFDTDHAASLFSAAQNLLDQKAKAGSGHTAWSATWQACLWARLGKGDRAWEALNKIDKYVTPNLLFLHPAMVKAEDAGEILTKYKEGDHDARKRRDACVSRGLKTLDKSPLDGNLGYVAAIMELLVQSHVPGSIHLLPALPSALGAFGRIVGVGGRGDTAVSISWSNSKIVAALIVVNSFHPWHAAKSSTEGGLVESPHGYFNWPPNYDESSNSSFLVISPEQLQLEISQISRSQMRKGKAAKKAPRRKDVRMKQECAQLIGFGKPSIAADPTGTRKGSRISVYAVPCQILMCPSESNNIAKCRSVFSDLLL